MYQLNPSLQFSKFGFMVCLPSPPFLTKILLSRNLVTSLGEVCTSARSSNSSYFLKQNWFSSSYWVLHTKPECALLVNCHHFVLLWPLFLCAEKPVLSKKNDTGIRVLAFEAASTIQSTALRGHPIPYFEWYRQPIGFCTSNCKPDEKKWRRVPRSVINPSAHVPSRVSSLFLAPSKSGYYFRCVAENALGRDDAVYHVHRMGKKWFY